MNPEEIKIKARPLAEPSICEFTLNQTLVEEPIRCGRTEEKGFFFESLFQIKDIQEVLVSEDRVTISKGQSVTEWGVLAKEVGQAIRNSLTSGKQLFSIEVNEEASKEGSHSAGPHGCGHCSCGSKKQTDEKQSDDIESEVIRVLETEINPVVASHGGKITLDHIEDSRVYVRLEGGCHGCHMASQTLKNGVEKHLKMRIPAIEAVIDATDHSTGEKPYC